MLGHYKMPVIFNDLLQEIITIPVISTSWKVSVLGVILVRIFPHSNQFSSKYGHFLRSVVKKGIHR